MNRTIARAPLAVAELARGRAAKVSLAALLLLGVAIHAHAQEAAVDPPSRVARLSDISGQVWLYNPEANEWQSVARNRPLTTGDRIATDNDARAEITLGTTTLRLDAATELDIVQLDDARYVVSLPNGSVAARLRNAQALAEFELQTDEGSFHVQTVGRYRFDRFEQTSDLTVLNGQAVFEGRNSALPLTTGQHAQFWLDASGAAQYSMVEPARDAFAAWNDERDRSEEHVATARYVSPEMTGAQDLDRYGSWEQTPDYGPIWIPTAVAAGWAPYSAGHWAWVLPWGWTWVDDAPWGFAPFHYGRWVYHHNAWCWAPGTYVKRPVYAPALVAWMGGPRVSVSISIGGHGGPPVGWFPLAPREVYVPSYRTSPRYVREVNITHVTNVTVINNIVNNRNGEANRRDFANRKFPNAVTVVPASVLTSREPVAPAAAQIRNNPQIRALVADAKPGPVMIAAPVAAPAVTAKTPEGRVPRPPFEGRAPGNFAGRPDGGRPGERSGVSQAVAAPATPMPPVAKPPPTGAATTAPTPTAVTPLAPARPQPGADPTAITRPPPRGAIGRDPVPIEPGAAPKAAPPPPVQRGSQSAEAIGRPGVPAHEVRPQGAAPVGEARAVVARQAIAVPPAPATRMDAAPPRTAVPPRGAEGQRPPGPVKAPEKAPEAQRQVPEAHVAKPETPHVAKEEKRDEKREPGEKPR